MIRTLFLTALLALMLGGMGGYWYASKSVEPKEVSAAPNKPKFYRHPMTPSITSPYPAKDDMGMDYIPIYEESTPLAVKKERKILYYQNPMGPDTSPEPKKDPMGMDYLPVYEEVPQIVSNGLQLSTEKIQKLGVKTALAEIREIAKTIRNVGVVEADERRLYSVVSRFSGFMEKLYVNATGQSVKQGQALFDVYSPEIVSAQQEYINAIHSPNLAHLAESSLDRLRNWGVANSEIAYLKQNEKVRHALTIRSAVSGIVMEKNAVEGGRIDAGALLFKIADLSQVWVMAEIYEQDLSFISIGQKADIRLDAYPSQTFSGKVAFVYPTLNPATRTVKVRIELQNPYGILKPMMYAQLEIAARPRKAMTVPHSAILDSGLRSIVLVDKGEGLFEPRQVKVGIRSNDACEILEGLNENERVVTSANFLIDAESQLKSVLGHFEAPLKHD